MKPINYKKFKKAELVHLLHVVIGDVAVMNHFKESWDFQIEDKGFACQSCNECAEIGRKLNLIE